MATPQAKGMNHAQVTGITKGTRTETSVSLLTKTLTGK